MRKFLLPLAAAAALQAGIMDFQTLSEAKSAYDKGDYTAAAERYGALKAKNDAARYDYANALYQQKKYAEAADVYATINDPSLKQKALHNLGNSLAMSGKTDEAIKAYDEALKLGDDEDTRYNLELLKKQKEQQKQQQSKDQHDQKNQQQNDKNQQNEKNDQNKNGQGKDQKNDQQNSQNGNDKQKQDQNSKQQQNGQQDQEERERNGQQQQQQNAQRQNTQEEQEQAPKEQQQADRNASDAAEKEQKERQTAGEAEEKSEGQQPESQQAQAVMAEPISDMEERKYNKMLDKRGIKTLMIPLSGKGEPHADETTPW